MQEFVRKELDRAAEAGLEIGLVLEGGTVFGGLVVVEVPPDQPYTVLLTSEGATLTIADDIIMGTMVDTSPPRWAKREVDLMSTAREHAAGAT